MIKIIKDGQKEFTTKCDTCGCEFSYQLVDIGLGSVVCPCCGGYVAHKFNNFENPPLATGKRVIPCNWIAPDVTITSANTDSWFDSLQIIRDLCIDYDGFRTVEGLKSLIDDIREISEESLKGTFGISDNNDGIDRTNK